MVMSAFPQFRRTNPCGADGQAVQQRERETWVLLGAGLGSRDQEKRCGYGINWAEEMPVCSYHM